MFNDEIEDDELDSEETADVELDEVDAEYSPEDSSGMEVDEADPIEDEGEVPASSKPKAVVEEDLPSVEGKRKERDALAEAMAAFLARGGKIQAVEPVDE